MENSLPVETVNEIKVKTYFKGKVAKTALAGALIDLGDGKVGLLHVSQMAAEGAEQTIKSVKEVLQEGQEIDVWVKKIKEGRIELTMVKPLDLEWRDIKKDMVVKGKVVRIETFGAFVEIGAERPGLIHISEMAHGYVKTPTDVVNEGDEVEAMVIDVNRKRKQIKLSMKALLPEPVREEPAPRPVEEREKKEKVHTPSSSASGSASSAPKKARKPRKDRSEGSFDNLEQIMQEINNPEGEETDTAMAIAWREAMERAKSRKQDDKAKKAKSVSSEQENILSRTLERKIGQ